LVQWGPAKYVKQTSKSRNALAKETDKFCGSEKTSLYFLQMSDTQQFHPK